MKKKRGKDKRTKDLSAVAIITLYSKSLYGLSHAFHVDVFHSSDIVVEVFVGIKRGFLLVIGGEKVGV